MTDLDHDGANAEKVSIGREGFLGLALILGGERALSRSVVRVSGSATLIPIPVLNEASERFACLRVATRRYAQTLVIQLMETVAGARIESSAVQVAHWLALAFDRMDGAVLELKQTSLQRASASGASALRMPFRIYAKDRLWSTPAVGSPHSTGGITHNRRPTIRNGSDRLRLAG